MEKVVKPPHRPADQRDEPPAVGEAEQQAQHQGTQSVDHQQADQQVTAGAVGDVAVQPPAQPGTCAAAEGDE
ncbi:hypothetical protein [Candidatus Corynebacterium faecigallinarum]|uniref:hypothetical protein n=1 Tax=Candidatus Corynebacterium faecigallinarum TaxID=2838528 RepID=UPI003FD0B9A9